MTTHGTILIHGSDGCVLAPVTPSDFIEGKWFDIRVTSVSSDEDLPESVREALVGLVIPTIFSAEQVKGAVPEGSRVAYSDDVAEALTAADKPACALDLLACIKEKAIDPAHHFVVFLASEYELVK